ncbi:MAG: tyrosine-type recombinase/integrase [Elusimicrobia bacterium]|nr:tyrosine-type recombinase/integrase [Elusimicrobiota bacterium]
MNRAKGYQLNVQRLDRDRVRLDFTHEGQRIRGIVMIEALVAFVNGGIDTQVNLAPGASITTLADFTQDMYVPVEVKTRLSNPKSRDAEIDCVRALCLKLGSKAVHRITAQDAEDCREAWARAGIVNVSIKKRLWCLRRVMDYAVRRGLIAVNPVPPVQGLSSGSRRDIYLTRQQIDFLLEHCGPVIRVLVEFMIWTGARINEALDLKKGDIKGGKLFLPTEKRRCPPRDFMRELDIESLGPRFARLLGELKPHPKTGFYFYAPGSDGRPLSYTYFQRLFSEAKKAAGLEHIRPHDTRGTFTVHRSLVVKTVRQLQIELGQSDVRSIDSYLARVKSFDPKESIFFVEPKQPEAVPQAAPPAPAVSVSDMPRPAEPLVPPAPPLLH